MKFLIQTLFNSYVFSQHHICFVSNFLRVRALTAEQTVAVSDQVKKARDFLTRIFLAQILRPIRPVDREKGDESNTDSCNS